MNIKPYLFPIASPVLTSLPVIPCIINAFLVSSFLESFSGGIMQLISVLKKAIPLADISRPMAIASQVGLDILVSGIALTGSVRADCNVRSSNTRLEAALWAGLSAIGTSTAMIQISQLVDGIKNFLNLDHDQQYFVLKHNSISSLGGNKACRAVFIDGLSSKWENKSVRDDVSHPQTETLYKNCDVRAYRVDGSNSICSKMEEGAASLGGPIDILMLSAHSSPNEMHLGEDYWLSKWNLEDIKCLRNKTAPTSQIILAGCNTATGNGSIAEKISQIAKDRQVTGYRANFNSFHGWYTFSEKRINSFTFAFEDSNNDWVLGNTERNFVTPDSSSPGQQVTQEQEKTDL